MTAKQYNELITRIEKLAVGNIDLSVQLINADENISDLEKQLADCQSRGLV